ncbi:C4-dicarboxylate ABC transporter [Desulfosporosinus fructosivorans]|uniref:C4-dicarboxylate ABC transporter n=1 Tax=Desulfosporosinus fructosivorans TaxID=2018669 RepID=A0A4Z0R6K7_9FIRM|nr:C4-dicarboxylate ABC transporter [Desulfosporosinus fructosivorans]TGE38468.1 C4-dicarboxylate ABC transporter [Desulfosporosinus fructosivorans]
MLQRHGIKYFAPGWFAVVMGTGGLANVLYKWQDSFSAGLNLGIILAALADVLYFLMLVPWIIRWVSFFKYAQRDLHHPVTSNFFVTMPVATIIVGTNISNIWSGYFGGPLTFMLITIAWMIGIVGVTFFTYYTTFRIMQIEVAPTPETTNFSWIMAPIANMATLLLGNSVLKMSLNYQPTWSMSILITNLAMLGIGFFLFIFISAVIFVRLAQYPLPPAELTPSFGILLSAVGLAVIAIIDTANNANNLRILASVDLAYLVAAVMWGFGIWVLGIIAMICFYHIRRGGFPYGLGWWAFIFPLAAYTIASQKIASIFSTPLTYWFCAFLTILLILLWCYTFFYTVVGVLNGKLFMGRPIPKSTQ